jgi:hypothetical protein
MDDIMEELEDVIHYFGYAKLHDNPYGFFDYS